jgi:hypothetical protein
MKSHFKNGLTMVMVALFSATTALPQDAQAVKNYLGGQRLLVTYRRGGPVYGTYFFFHVNLCRSGSYVTRAQSRKQNVVYERTEQVHIWPDRGRWDVGVFAGQVGVQYVSWTSGESNFIPVSIRADGSIAAGNGMSVVREGSAQCM